MLPGTRVPSGNQYQGIADMEADDIIKAGTKNSSISKHSSSKRRLMDDADDIKPLKPPKLTTNVFSGQLPATFRTDSCGWSRLPPKIRNEIWSWVFLETRSRLYIPYAPTIGDSDRYRLYQHSLPQSMLACKEAFAVAVHRKRRAPVWKNVNYTALDNGGTIHNWIDPSQDSVYLHFGYDIKGGFEHITNSFETITINLGPFPTHIELLKAWYRAMGPIVKRIRIVCGSYKSNIPRGSVDTLNDFLHIDVDDEKDIEFLSSLRDRYPSSSVWRHVYKKLVTKADSWKLAVHKRSTASGFQETEDGYRIWMDMHKNFQHISYLPKETKVKNSESFLAPHEFHLSWERFAIILGQIWEERWITKERPSIHRVIELRLGS